MSKNEKTKLTPLDESSLFVIIYSFYTNTPSRAKCYLYYFRKKPENIERQNYKFEDDNVFDNTVKQFLDENFERVKTEYSKPAYFEEEVARAVSIAQGGIHEEITFNCRQMVLNESKKLKPLVEVNVNLTIASDNLEIFEDNFKQKFEIDVYSVFDESLIKTKIV